MKKFFSSIKTTRGFTLIELLIVVAIIGILSAVVLGSLGSARDKARISKIKSQMASLRSQATLYASSNNDSYLGLDVLGSGRPDNADTIIKELQKDTGMLPVFYVTDNAWAAYVPVDSKKYCVDSNGYSGFITGFAAAPDAPACKS